MVLLLWLGFKRKANEMLKTKTNGKTKSAATNDVKEVGEYFVFLLDYTNEFYVCLASNVTQDEARLVVEETDCADEQSIVMSHGDLDVERTIGNWQRIDTCNNEFGRRQFA